MNDAGFFFAYKGVLVYVYVYALFFIGGNVESFCS